MKTLRAQNRTFLAVIAAVSVAVVGLFGYYVYLQSQQQAKAVVKCPSDLYKGKVVTWTFKAKDALTNDYITNISLYQFQKEPEDWGDYQKVPRLKSKADKVVRITSVDGAQVQVKTGDKFYILADGDEYYPEFVNVTIPVPQPPIAVPKAYTNDVEYIRAQCVEKYKTVSEALAAAGIEPVTEITMKPAKDLYLPYGTTITIRKVDSTYRGSAAAQVDYGSYYLLDKIVFERGSAFNKTEKIVVRITAGSFSKEYVVYDATGEETTGLLADVTTKTLDEFNGKDVIVLKTPKGGPVAQISIDVEVTPAEGQTLNSGDVPVCIKLVDADPEEVNPVKFCARVP